MTMLRTSAITSVSTLENRKKESTLETVFIFTSWNFKLRTSVGYFLWNLSDFVFSVTHIILCIVNEFFLRWREWMQFDVTVLTSLTHFICTCCVITHTFLFGVSDLTWTSMDFKNRRCFVKCSHRRWAVFHTSILFKSDGNPTAPTPGWLSEQNGKQAYNLPAVAGDRKARRLWRGGKKPFPRNRSEASQRAF